MTLEKSRRRLQEYTRLEASDRNVAKAGNDKLLIDQNIKAAQAAAGTASGDAGAAAELASQAIQDAFDAAVTAALGERAFLGEHAGPGVIDAIYQDHGVGENLLNYRDVYLGWRPYAWYTYDDSPYTNNFDVWYDTELERDALRAYSELDLFNSLGYRHITKPNVFSPSKPLLASIHVRTFSGRPCDFQLRVEEYATLSNANFGTGATQISTGPLQALAGNSRYRIALPFTASTAPYLVVRVRVRRTGGVVGNLSICSIYNWMVEEVVEGQTVPSKFVMPEPRRGDLGANALEAGALEGFVSGCGISRVSATEITIEAGAAYVPSVEKIVAAPAQSLTPTLTLAGVRYVYLDSTLDGTSASYSSTTTAPDVPYFGSARTYPGDPSRRFIGVYVIYGGDLPRFKENEGYYTYQDPISNRLLSISGSTTATEVSATGYVPEHCRLAELQALVDYTDANCTLYVGPANVAFSGGAAPLTCSAGSNGRGPNRTRGPVQLNSALEFTRQATASGQLCSVAILGFWYDR